MDNKLTKKAFIDAYTNSFGNISQSCKAVGIVRQTYYNWRTEDKEFANTIDSLEPKEVFLDFVESKLVEKINAGDTTSIIFALKTKGKSRDYIERQEVSGPEGYPAKVELNIIKNES